MNDHDQPDDVAIELRRAFTGRPRTLPPRWLYDDRGSELFTEITRLPEYYQTEAERSILAADAGSIARTTEATTVVELGSGTSDKTRTLLDAFTEHGSIERFIPFDVSEQTLLDAAEMLGVRHPSLDVVPVVGDFTRDLARIGMALDPNGSDDDDADGSGPALFVFLGGTIGNFYVEQRHAFLASLAAVARPGDWLMIGIDQIKPIDRLIAAYDDSDRVTEAFIRNALTNINATFGGDIDVDRFGYVPMWDGRQERIDMRLRADAPVAARLDRLDLDIDLAFGEEIRVEISAKFRPAAMLDELAVAGFAVAPTVFADAADDFALVLVRR